MNIFENLLGSVLDTSESVAAGEVYRRNIDYFIPPIIIIVVGGFAYMFDYYNNFAPTTAEINSSALSCALENRVETNFFEKVTLRNDYKTIVTKHMDCNTANNLRNSNEKWRNAKINIFSTISFKYTSPIDGKSYDKTREISGEAYPGQMLNIEVWKYNSKRIHIKKLVTKNYNLPA